MLGYELIEDNQVASPVTDISFTGLTISEDDDYILVSEINGVADLQIFFNGNETTTNYYTQQGQVNGGTKTATRGNFNRMSAGSASYKSHGETRIKLTKDGYICALSDILEQFNNATGAEIGSYYTTSTFTATSITTIKVKAASGNIGAGSRFKLYKLVAEKVGEVETTTNETTVTIDNLTINSDSELLLVSDITNNGGTSDYYLYLDGITTTYYSQKLLISNVSFVGTQLNTATYCSALNGRNILNYARIKISNRGIINSYSKGLCSVGYTFPYTEQASLSRTSIISADVTEIDITAATSNGIATGSKFTLYKLY